MTRWLSVAVFVAPLIVAPATWGLSIAETKNLGFLVLAAGTIVWLVDNPWLRAFTAWSVFAFFVAGARPWAVSTVLGILGWALLCHLARTLTEAQWHSLRLAITAGVLVQVGWTLLQRFGHDPVFVPLRTQGGYLPPHVDPMGWFGNPMDLAVFLGVSLPLVAAAHPVLAAVTALVMLWLLPTTAGALAIGVTAVWLAWRAWPRWWVLAAAGVLVAAAELVYLAYWDPQGPGQRPLIWRQMAHLIALRPITGWGPGAIDASVVLITPSNGLRWNFGFNEYLQGALEFGLPAVGCAVGGLAALAWRLRGRLEAAAELVPAVVILALAAGFSIPFRIGPAALVAALVVGQLDRRLA